VDSGAGEAVPRTDGIVCEGMGGPAALTGSPRPGYAVALDDLPLTGPGR
jgi:hypothetical protein